jgi:hypothetical protein
MRTLFTLGFSRDPFLGQTSSVSDDRKQLYSDLSQAQDKYAAITDWKKSHLNLSQVLGDDFDNWQMLSQDDDIYGSTADEVKKALDKDLNTSIDPGDMMAADNWVTAINRMYVLMANHTGTPAAAPAPAPQSATSAPSAPAAASQPAPSSAPAVPSNAPKASPGAPAASPAPQAAGKASNTALYVGVGAAALLGLVLIASSRG